MKKLWEFTRTFNAGDWIATVVVGGLTTWVLWYTVGNLWNIAIFSLQPPLPDSDELTRIDVIAQRSMAAAAWWMVFITSISSLVGGLGLYLIARTLQEAKRSADQAQRSADAAERAVSAAHAANEENRRLGQAQVRAYMVVKSATVMRYMEGTIRVDFKLYNSGQTPASVVSVKTDFWLEFSGSERGPWTPTSERHVEIKTRSDIPGGEDRSGKTSARHFMTDEMYRLAYMSYTRFLVDITISYRDVFEVVRTETAYYGVTLKPEQSWGPDMDLYRIHL